MENRFYVMRTDNAKDLPLPSYMSKGAAGMDLYANIDEDIMIRNGEIKLIPTGIKIALPEGYEAQVRPRSGLALKEGITVLNTPGTIDSDYRGEISVILVNFGNKGFIVKRGERIAQMIINRYEHIVWTECNNLDETERGEGGFGHSGL